MMSKQFRGFFFVFGELIKYSFVIYVSIKIFLCKYNPFPGLEFVGKITKRFQRNGNLVYFDDYDNTIYKLLLTFD